MDAGELTIRLTHIERMARQARESISVVAHLSGIPKTPIFDAQGQDPQAPQRAMREQGVAIADQSLDEMFRLTHQLYQLHSAMKKPQEPEAGPKLSLVGEGP